MEHQKSLSSLNPTAAIFIPEKKCFQGYDTIQLDWREVLPTRTELEGDRTVDRVAGGGGPSWWG